MITFLMVIIVTITHFLVLCVEILVGFRRGIKLAETAIRKSFDSMSFTNEEKNKGN